MSDDTEIVTLRDDFYRDGFTQLIGVMIAILGAIVIMTALAVYLYVTKPLPITFQVGEDWRTQPAVALDQPYLSTADMLQWVSNVIPDSFNYDFINYNDQLAAASKHFTDNGWKAFLIQLNKYANYNTVQTGKVFVSGEPTGAPTVPNQGLILGRYGWWVDMPIAIKYRGGNAGFVNAYITLHVLVVRVPTLNNLLGVGIDDVQLPGKAAST